MATPGRNAPCPCGSGRKVKKCHPDRLVPPGWVLEGGEDGAPGLAFHDPIPPREGSGPTWPCGCPVTDEDRDASGRARPHEHDEEVDPADAPAWPQVLEAVRIPLPEEAPTPEAAIVRRFLDSQSRRIPELLRYAADRFGRAFRPEECFAWIPEGEPELMSLLAPCAAFHYPLDGRTVAEWFLAERGAEVPEEERSWIEAEGRSWLSIWEVTAVDPGRWLEVHDLLTGERRRMAEEVASRSLVRWDTFLGAVVDGPGASTIRGIHPRVLGPMQALEVVESLVAGEILGTLPVAPSALRTPTAIAGLLDAWEFAPEGGTRERRPPSRNEDGELRTWSRDRFAFDPSAREAVRARLDRLKGAAGWEDRDGEPVLRVVKGGTSGGAEDGLASVHLDRGHVDVVTNSIRRANEARRRVESACNRLVRLVGRERRDPEEALLDLAAPGADPLPPAVAARMKEILFAFVQELVDSPRLAPGRRTLRELARDPAQRERAAAALKEIEREAAPLVAAVSLDLSPVWRELGLDP